VNGVLRSSPARRSLALASCEARDAARDVPPAGTPNPILLGGTANAGGAGSSHPLAPGEADVRLAIGEALAGRREPASDDEVPGPAVQPPVRGGSGTAASATGSTPAAVTKRRGGPAAYRDAGAATAVGVAAPAEAAP
jgi:hypothetical protein